MRNTFAQLLDGLREVHTAKLLHLDIKPANVYLRNDGTPLLIDFGAARQVLSAEGVKLPPLYTPGFAAPEMHDQRELLGPWSDIYSVGATMYACLARAQRRSRRTRASKPTRWCRRAAPGPASTPPTCSRSSTGACARPPEAPAERACAAESPAR